MESVRHVVVPNGLVVSDVVYEDAACSDILVPTLTLTVLDEVVLVLVARVVEDISVAAVCCGLDV